MPHIEVVDPSRLRDSLQCLRLYYWRNERHIVPIKPRLPLSYGGAAHACLAEHYCGKPAGVCLSAFEKIWDREVTQFQSSLEEEDPKRNPVRWAEQFLLYRKHYHTEPFTIWGDGRGVEVPFFLPLTDDLALAGIIDLLGIYLNQIIVIDHKTTSVMYQSYFDSFNPNHQFSLYLIGATELLEEPVTTLLVNCILVSSRENSPEKMFIRVPTTRSVWQLQQTKEELIGWWQVVRECRRTGNWPRNDDRCQRWKGGCPYHILCTEVQYDYRKIRPSPALFKEEVWDPIAELRLHGLEVTA